MSKMVDVNIEQTIHGADDPARVVRLLQEQIRNSASRQRPSFFQRATTTVREAVRGAFRELLLREVDRVLSGIMEPGVEQYDVKGESGEVFSFTPDQFLALLVAVRARFRVEL